MAGEYRANRENPGDASSNRAGQWLNSNGKLYYYLSFMILFSK